MIVVEELDIRAGTLVNAASLFLQVTVSLFKLIPVEKVPVTCLVILSVQY